jgi:hypothetical protein
VTSSRSGTRTLKRRTSGVAAALRTTSAPGAELAPAADSGRARVGGHRRNDT